MPTSLFIAGFIGGILGLSTSDHPPNESVSEVRVEPVKTADKTADKTSVEPQRTAQEKWIVPAFQTPRDAVEWIAKQKLMRVEGEGIVLNWEGFRRFSVDDILRIYELFDAAPAEPPTDALDIEEQRKRLRAMRILIFAGAAGLDTESRRDFASRSGAVFPKSVFSHRVRSGDYMALMNWHKTASNVVISEYAIREYAKVLTDKEMIAVLEDCGAITIPNSGDNPKANGKWRVHAGECLAAFRPDTLWPIHDAIKDGFMGDRPKLRAQIMQLIERYPSPPREVQK